MSADTERPHVVIVGAMGVGKSTTAAALAATLGREFADSDPDIERLTGHSGAELAEAGSVQHLHELERAVLLGSLARTTPLIIAAAASVVDRADVRTALKRRATVIRLTLSEAETLARQETGNHRRPMSAGELAALAARREPLFREVEDMTLAADRPTRELVAAILAHLGS